MVSNLGSITPKVTTSPGYNKSFDVLYVVLAIRNSSADNL